MKASLRLTLTMVIACAGCAAQSDDSDTLAACEQGLHLCSLQSASLDAGVVQSGDGGRRRPDAGVSASTTNGPWTSEGLPPLPPPRSFEVPDEDIAFIVRDGIGGWAFAACTSEAPGTASIDDDSALPVGDGRALVCTTYEAPAFVTQMVQAQDGSMYCVKGAAVRYRSVSDPRLRVRVTAGSPTGPWTLRATSDVAWTVAPISFSVGVVWPLWLELQYQTIDVTRAPPTGCEGGVL